MSFETRRDAILSENPIATFLERQGIQLRGSTPKLHCSICPYGAHKPTHFCVEINIDKGLWYCHDHEIGGSIIDWEMERLHITADQAIDRFNGETNGEWPVASRKPPRVSKQRAYVSEPSTAEAEYNYTDENGNLIYQAVRYPDKNFKQRHPNKDGTWNWNMTGISRVLFQLPKVLLAQQVAIAEGEKDCLNLSSYGYAATCNVGGAGKWLDAYNDFLRNKDVLIFFDNDDAGRTHADKIISSLRDKANSLKKIQLPAIFKDISEYLESFEDKEHAQTALTELISRTPHLLKPPPIYSIQEMEEDYRRFVRRLPETSYDLSKFLPQLNVVNRALSPGEMVLLMADTGVGKSCLAQALARCAAPLPTLFFELELPMQLMFERFVQMEIGCKGEDVETEYKNSSEPMWKSFKGLQHIMVCPEAGITVEQIESYIIKSQLRFGKPAAVVFVDYVGLVKGFGRSRYEAISHSAEQFKTIAKRTGVIMFVATQISRPEHKNASQEVRLHDARDSGALENSAGLVIGCWRPEPNKMCIKILKNTKGNAGTLIEAKFDGAKMRIYSDPIQTNANFA